MTGDGMNNLIGKSVGEVGEIRLLDELILPMARTFDQSTKAGDDCAYIEVGGQLLAATGDVGPRPIIQNLKAHRDDWEAAGWLAVVATASDVASAGARPLFMTNCIDAPADLSVDALAGFMRGYFTAIAEFGFRNGGGDLRQGPNLLARVFGVGVVEHGSRIGRSGAMPGDHLVVIGPAGSFMANYLMATIAEASATVETSPEGAPERMRFPRPQLVAMEQLAGLGLVVSASDTSDSLLGAVDNIARGSHCGFHLRLKESMLAPEVRAAYERSDVASVWNIFFAWGDWSIAAIVPARDLGAFEAACSSLGIEWRYLGVATSNLGLTAELEGEEGIQDLAVLRNENFVARSFNAEITGHLDYLLRTPLFRSRKSLAIC